MPEIAEVKIMTEFINSKLNDVECLHILQHEDNRNSILENDFPSNFKVKAFSRGKEIQLVFNNTLKITFTLGMSGNWLWSNPYEEIPQYSQFIISTPTGHMSFVDMRKFGTWKVRDWNDKRGPDPIDEFQKFQDNITQNVKTHNDFNKPLHEILLNQKWFNGIGNYLRAEILGRIDFNPFLSLRELYNHNIIEYIKLLNLCRDIPSKVYDIGGAQLRDWINPFYVDKTEFENFIQFYRNTEQCTKIKDKHNRTFWFDKKWNK